MSDSERLAVIETVVMRIDHELLGNGQPGRMTVLEKKVARLEQWRWWVGGLAFGLGPIIGAIAGAFGHKFLAIP